MDQILQKLDLAGIQDERARECIRLLLNLIESLRADLRKAHAENLYLREQLNRAKVEGARGTGPKTVRRRPTVSEKERGEPSETNQRTKRSKLDRVRVRPGRDTESRPDIPATGCPSSRATKRWWCKSYASVTDNVKFRKEKYYAASTGRSTWRRCPPAGYRGEFGPNLKSLCVLFSHLCNMTEPKMHESVENLGIVISSGQISAWLTGAYPEIQEEKRAIVAFRNASSHSRCRGTGAML